MTPDRRNAILKLAAAGALVPLQQAEARIAIDRHAYPSLADAQTVARSGGLAVGALLAVAGFASPGDGGDFLGIVEAEDNPSYPMKGRIRPLGPVSVRIWGALGDGVADDYDAVQAAANFCRHVKDQATGGDVAVAARYLVFPQGIYNLKDRIVDMPPFVSLRTWDGEAVIKKGGFSWARTYDTIVSGLKFIDPPVRRSRIERIDANYGGVRVLAPGHSFREGDFLRFRGNNGLFGINGRGFVIDQVTPDGFSLADANRRVFGTTGIGGEALHGAAIEFDTDNVSRAQFRVEDCSCYGQAGAGQCFVSSRDFQSSRSTELTLANCKTGKTDKILHSACDSVLIDGGFYWHENPGEAAIFIEGKLKVFGGAFIPRTFEAGTCWIDYDVGYNPSSKGAHFYGVRFSGEGGGISVIRILATSDPMKQNLNSDSIHFNGCTITSRKGGPPNALGGIVILGPSITGDSACPNGIAFSVCDINIGKRENGYVTTDNGRPPDLRDGYNFVIDVDALSARVLKRMDRSAVDEVLQPYLAS